MVFDQGAQQFDDLVGLLQMNAICTGFFPQEWHCIHAKNGHPVIQILADDAHKLHQHIGVFEIQVYLIGAESAPDMTSAIGGFHLGQQR